MQKLMTLVFVWLMAACMQAPQTDLEGFKAMRNVWQSAYDSKDPAAIAAIYADAGGAIIDNGKYVDIWRQVDSKWRISRAIWNSNLPLATPEPEPEDEAEVADEV